MRDPHIDLADNTYSRLITTNIEERRRYGRLEGYTSATIGNHYLRLTMSGRQKQSFDGIPQDVRVGIRLHAGQVKQLRNFLNKWLDCHYKQN